MTRENPIMLIDTNVWIDYYDGERTGHRSATSLIIAAFNKRISIVYAPTSIKDLFYIIGAMLKEDARRHEDDLREESALAIQEVAWGCVEHMADIATAVSIGEPQIWLARHYKPRHGDFEDNLVLAAVEASSVDYFVTNDRGLMGKTSCPTFTCADMLARLTHE